nr:MAG TPA: hypothetical protein [Caudoviricetes sp.]
MIQYNHQIKKGNDNMNKPKITLDELIEIAFSYDSLNSHKVLDYLYREDFKDALDDVTSMLNILGNNQNILKGVIESAVTFYDKDEPTRIAYLILDLDEEYYYDWTFEGLTTLLKNIRNKERLELYQVILDCITFDDVDLEFLNILQKYNAEEREIILDNARNLSANEMIYQIRSSIRIVQKMSETLEFSDNSACSLSC